MLFCIMLWLPKRYYKVVLLKCIVTVSLATVNMFGICVLDLLAKL